MKGISGGELGPANVVKPGSSVAAKGGLIRLSRPNRLIPNGKNADTGKRKKSPLLDNRPELQRERSGRIPRMVLNKHG
jgi:hypothetical protein